MNFLVIDGNSIINRAFYGVRDLSTKEGIHTNAIYGFMNIFFKLLEQTKPECVAVAFDLKKPTFRHKMYADYKAGRKPMPPELAEQFPYLKDLLRALGYTVVEKEGYEADDILGTLSAQCNKQGERCYIATGDRDSLQLVNERVSVLLASTQKGQPVTVEYTPELIKEKYGVEPVKLIEIKAIQGDTSDNIPGVAGIGEKGAQELISRFGSVAYIYENLDDVDIKPAMRSKLAASRQNCFLSRELGMINLEVPMDTDLEHYKIAPPDEEESLRILRKLEMKSIINKLSFTAPENENAAVVETFTVGFEIAEDLFAFADKLKAQSTLYFNGEYADDSLSGLYFAVDNTVFFVDAVDLNFYAFIADIFESDIPKAVDNVKPLYTAAEKFGTNLNNVVMDTSLAGYILEPDAKEYSALTLAEKYAVPSPATDEVQREIAVKACAVLPVLSEKLRILIENNQQSALLNEMEIPFAQVLASMEIEGFLVDKEGIVAFGEQLGVRIEEITAQIYALVGRKFNINSPKQLGVALFEDLQLPCKKKTKSGYSTKAEVLEGLVDAHPVIALILEYRSLSKLKSTYCDGLVKVISPDGRIHSSFNQTETRTGRISSTEPNLQNIPIRTKLGMEMRKFFKADEGCKLVDADYSQIELRVLADIAGDENMKKAFNEDADIHAITASEVFGVPLEEVNSEMRRSAKAVNFGIVYGIGAFSLAKDIGVTRKEADSYIKGYLYHFSGIDRYMQEVITKAKADGFVSTSFGRRRYLPELKSHNGMIRSFGERVARNMPIQGTAADIIKIAMIKVYRRLKRENLKSKLILQVHDELIIEASDEESEYIKALLKEEMENACQMNVKLKADVGCGKTWYEAKA
ncbi:MAG: DNA polymerase I [Ruminococcaceae bacterium]|nr:DNA polymerase I [Oscillospiraceae bacterium]